MKKKINQQKLWAMWPDFYEDYAILYYTGFTGVHLMVATLN